VALETTGNSVKSNRGAALIIVLWLVASLSLVVLAGAQSIRLQARRTALDLERLRAESVLDPAIELVTQRLLADRGKSGGYRIQRLALGESDAWVEITPSGGLVDVNVASEALLQALLQRVGGLPAGEAAVLASRIRGNGDPGAPPGNVGGIQAATPRNAALEDPAELQSMPGMTAGLYEIIAPYLGINGQQRIEIDSAPPALIDALTGQQGLGARVHHSPPEMRAGLLISGTAAEYFSPASVSGGQTVRLRAFVQTQGGRWWLREAWVDLGQRLDALTPWTTLSLEPTRRHNMPEQEKTP